MPHFSISFEILCNSISQTILQNCSIRYTPVIFQISPCHSHNVTLYSRCGGIFSGLQITKSSMKRKFCQWPEFWQRDWKLPSPIWQLIWSFINAEFQFSQRRRLRRRCCRGKVNFHLNSPATIIAKTCFHCSFQLFWLSELLQFVVRRGRPWQVKLLFFFGVMGSLQGRSCGRGSKRLP